MERTVYVFWCKQRGGSVVMVFGNFSQQIFHTHTLFFKTMTICIKSAFGPAWEERKCPLILQRTDKQLRSKIMKLE